MILRCSRAVLLLASATLLSCSGDPRCESEDAQLELDVRTRDVALAARAHSLLITVEAGAKTTQQVAELGHDFLDGKLLVPISIAGMPEGEVTAKVSITAFELPAARGTVLDVKRTTVEASASACRRTEVELDLAGEPAPDAGVLPGADAGADAGIGDGQVVRGCGDGTIDPGEDCDDGDRLEGNGCSPECAVELGWTCSGEPSFCTRQIAEGFRFRRAITVDTGTAAPENGFIAYTLRVGPIDTALMQEQGNLREDCADLRIVMEREGRQEDLPRHLLGCGTATTELHFMSRTALDAASDVPSYYLYYGNTEVPPPAPVAVDNVYLWYDDASTDRTRSYLRGKFDGWHELWDERGLTWDLAGFYSYDTGNDVMAGYRAPIDERDVYIEVELYHSDCYSANMTTGVFTRFITTSTTPALESSDHYYLTSRGFQRTCQGAEANRYPGDGDLVKGDWRAVLSADPQRRAVQPGEWRKQALASWGAGPTWLRAWDADVPWPSSGWPDQPNLTGATDVEDLPTGGAAGVVTAQDAGRFRRLLIRRYYEPEPKLELGPEEAL